MKRLAGFLLAAAALFVQAAYALFSQEPKAMKRLAGFFLAAAALFAQAAYAQTNITATNLKMAGAKITTGVVTATPVNANGVAIPFADASGSQNGPTAFACQVTNGAIVGMIQPDGTVVTGPCGVPDAALTLPANILYTLQVSDLSTGRSTSGKSYTLSNVVGVTGSTWALDHYGPVTATTNVQPVMASHGPTTPTSCVSPSIFTNDVTTVFSTCIGGVLVPVGGSGGGTTPTFTMGTVTALSAGSTPTATFTGTAPNYILNLAIPAGATGAAGSAGATGATGAAGTTPTFTIGTVTTLAAGSPATASLTGTAPAYVLNLGIPTGATGAAGSGGGSTYTATGPLSISGTTISIAIATDSQAGAMSAADHATLTSHSNRISPTSTSTIEADYDFATGALTDAAGVSGPLTNCTAGSPTYSAVDHAYLTAWVGTGSNPCFDIPSSITSWTTAEFSVNISQAGLSMVSTPSGNYLASLIGPSGAYGSTEPWLFLAPANSLTTNGVWSPYVYKGGATVASKDLLTGYHEIAVSCGSTSHIYIDGVETSSYVGQANCAATLSGGQNFELMSGNSNAGAFDGKMYRATLFSSQLSGATIIADQQARKAKLVSLGIALTNPVLPLNTATRFTRGDSITSGNTVVTTAQTWASNLTLTTPYTFTEDNKAIFNITADAILGMAPERDVKLCRGNGGPVLAENFSGTNNLATSPNTYTPIQIWGFLAGWAKLMKNAGCIVAVGTPISRAGVETTREALVALIRQNWQAVGIDILYDFAATALGTDAANAGSNFQTDHTHPTAAGQLLLAVAPNNAINYFFGSTEASPSVMTTVRTMLAGDRYVSLAGLTAAGNITLPDCTGQTGAKYTINNPQSAYAVTIQGASGQPVNGLTSTITVPSNGSLTIRDVPNAPTTGGCHWEI